MAMFSLNTLPEEADAQYLHNLADQRNWGYSVLFVNDTDEVKALFLLVFLEERGPKNSLKKAGILLG